MDVTKIKYIVGEIIYIKLESNFVGTSSGPCDWTEEELGLQDQSYLNRLHLQYLHYCCTLRGILHL